MALADNITALAESIVPASSSEYRTTAVDLTKDLLTKVFDHIKDNAEITLETSLNTVFTGGVAVPMDGGLALQTAWKAATAAGAADSSGII